MVGHCVKFTSFRYNGWRVEILGMKKMQDTGGPQSLIVYGRVWTPRNLLGLTCYRANFGGDAAIKHQFQLSAENVTF